MTIVSEFSSVLVQSGPPIEIEVALSRADILSMNGGSPPEVVAAPGANKITEFISAILIYDRETATYANGGDVTIEYSGGATVSTTIAAADSFGSGTDEVFDFMRLNAAGGLTKDVNTALVITNATGAFTDPGTAAGIARLQITYKIHTTGL